MTATQGFMREGRAGGRFVIVTVPRPHAGIEVQAVVEVMPMPRRALSAREWRAIRDEAQRLFGELMFEISDDPATHSLQLDFSRAKLTSPCGA